MPNPTNYITPEEAKTKGDTRSLKELRHMAKASGLCEVCETEEIWRFGGTGLCFSCTTGEADPSKDYEIVVAK